MDFEKKIANLGDISNFFTLYYSNYKVDYMFCPYSTFSKSLFLGIVALRKPDSVLKIHRRRKRAFSSKKSRERQKREQGFDFERGLFFLFRPFFFGLLMPCQSKGERKRGTIQEKKKLNKVWAFSVINFNNPEWVKGQEIRVATCGWLVAGYVVRLLSSMLRRSIPSVWGKKIFVLHTEVWYFLS